METKKIGIWMDHTIANLMEVSNSKIKLIPCITKTTKKDLEDPLFKGEKTMHQNEQNEQSEYYKDITAEIVNYDKVLLFGPTNAKIELRNLLRSDHHFNHVDIETKAVGKLTENQQVAFVRSYFAEN